MDEWMRGEAVLELEQNFIVDTFSRATGRLTLVVLFFVVPLICGLVYAVWSYFFGFGPLARRWEREAREKHDPDWRPGSPKREERAPRVKD